MEQNECKRCGHKWYPRSPEKSPVCPKCRTIKWWKENPKTKIE